jgi:hypothetical protein
LVTGFWPRNRGHKLAEKATECKATFSEAAKAWPLSLTAQGPALVNESKLRRELFLQTHFSTIAATARPYSSSKHDCGHRLKRARADTGNLAPQKPVTTVCWSACCKLDATWDSSTHPSSRGSPEVHCRKNSVLARKENCKTLGNSNRGGLRRKNTAVRIARRQAWSGELWVSTLLPTSWDHFVVLISGPRNQPTKKPKR